MGKDNKSANGKAAAPLRSRAGAAAMFAFAAGLAAYAIHLAVTAWNQDFLPGAPSDAPRDDFALIVMVLLVAMGAFHVARRLLAPAGEQVLAQDHRPPVVYLRPFDEDSRRIHGMPVGERIGGRRIETLSEPGAREQKLARALAQIGPFVAVGTPGDALAPLGAARLYLSDDAWQAEVETLVRRAAAIVLVPEISEGTRWEVAKVVRWADPRRVLMIVPNPAQRPLGYARIQQLSAQSLPVALPAECRNADAFLFDARHRPRALVFGRHPARALEAFAVQLQQLTEAAP